MVQNNENKKNSARSKPCECTKKIALLARQLKELEDCLDEQRKEIEKLKRVIKG